jgi:hypothetical protein
MVLMLSSLFTLAACGNATQVDDIVQETSPITQETIPAPSTTQVEAPVPGVAHAAAVRPATNEVRQAERHTHGDASLAVIIEGTSLTIELETPLFNLTGFEHAPETTEEVATMEAAEAKLMQSEALFSITDQAKCTSADDDLEIHLGEDGHGEQKDEHHDSDDNDTHQDIVITYTFQCENPNRLSEVDIALLKVFPNMTDMEVAYLGSSTQRFFTLDQTNTKINLRP